MAEKFDLRIVTPEREFYNDECESLVITTTEGEMGILHGHLSMVVALVTAPARVKMADGAWRVAALSQGFAKIGPNSAVLFVDTAEWPEEIEENRALRAKARAEERLQAHLSEVEYFRSKVALDRALVRITVKNNELLKK